jgi:HTH-type transcriptional regulator/antitoxin HigA
MEIKPIRTVADHRRALREIEHLWNAPPRSPEHDRLEVLETLVVAWEEKHVPIGPPDPVEAIRFRLDQMGLGQSDLARILGSRARASEVLNHRRALTLPMMRKLHRELGIPADILLAG